METAGDVIQSALEDVLVAGATEPLDPADTKKALKYLNRMMSEWSARGIQLGYTAVNDPDELVTVPDAAITGIVSNLAIRLAPAFGASVTPELAAAAREGFQSILHIAVNVQPMSLGATLPMGSGNIDDHCDERFYDDPDSTINTELGRNIGLESGT